MTPLTRTLKRTVPARTVVHRGGRVKGTTLCGTLGVVKKTGAITCPRCAEIANPVHVSLGYK